MGVHHVELWVPELEGAAERWAWLLGELGWEPFQDWPAGRSWRDPASRAYVVVEQSPALRPGQSHDRLAPGLNHLALTVPSRAVLEAIVTAAPQHGWTLLFPERHPHAGGPQHYAAYLEDADGYEVELVAD